MEKKPLAASHGECQIIESKIPKGAVRLEVGKELKLADSEVTGNHHLIENAEGCEFYELDGVRYMRNTQPAKVRCVLEDRHDTIEIPTGEWEFGIAQEYDYITESVRNVMD